MGVPILKEKPRFIRGFFLSKILKISHALKDKEIMDIGWVETISHRYTQFVDILF